VAAVTIPEMALGQDEAHALAVALANVQKHYPGVRLLSDKHMALVSLALVSGRIYAPRAMILLTGKRPPRNVTPKAPAAPAPGPEADPSTISDGWFAAMQAPSEHVN
jgi:hypothetical protein